VGCVDEMPQEEAMRHGHEKNAVGGYEKRVQVPLERQVTWKTLWIDWSLLAKYMGPGLLVSVAYLDPGNLASDIQNGSLAKYSMLWVLLWATIAGLVLQVLAAKIGIVTGKGLAEICRAEYKTLPRIFLWAMTETSIIAADIQYILGTAVAWRALLGIPLWAGVLAAGLVTFVLLGLYNFGIRTVEAVVSTLILATLVCFWIIMWEIRPPVTEVVIGTLNPTDTPSYAVPLMVSTLGCMIMPHNLYLHSALVCSRNIDIHSQLQVSQAKKYNKIESSLALFVAFLINISVVSTFAVSYFDNFCANDLQAKLPLDMCAAGDVQQGPDGPICCASIGLENAGSALGYSLGNSGLYLWAVGLLLAGQVSTFTGALAGQYVMEGFLSLQMPVWTRLMLTRCVVLVPTIITGFFVPDSTHVMDLLNTWLNVLQSMQLPFALLPVLHFTSDSELMGPFTNDLRTQAVCWAIALALIFVNIFSILQQFLNPESDLKIVLPAVAGGFAVYVSFIIYLAFPGFKNFVYAIRHRTRTLITGTLIKR